MTTSEAFKILTQYIRWRNTKGKKYSQPLCPVGYNEITQALEIAMSTMNKYVGDDEFISIVDLAKIGATIKKNLQETKAQDSESLNKALRIKTKIQKKKAHSNVDKTKQL